MGILMLVLTLILAGVLALFGAQNTEPIALHFLWFTVHSLPVWRACNHRREGHDRQAWSPFCAPLSSGAAARRVWSKATER